LIFTNVFIVKTFSRRVHAAKNGENFATAFMNPIVSLDDPRCCET